MGSNWRVRKTSTQLQMTGRTSVGGWLAGLVFSGFGLIILYFAAFGRMPSENTSPELTRLVVALVAILVLLLGATLAFYRPNLLFDRIADRVTRQSQLIVGLRSRHWSLSQFSTVTIREGRTSRRADAVLQYAVCLTGADGDAPLIEGRTLADARELADAIADFLNRPVHELVAQVASLSRITRPGSWTARARSAALDLLASSNVRTRVAGDAWELRAGGGAASRQGLLGLAVLTAIVVLTNGCRFTLFSEAWERVTGTWFLRAVCAFLTTMCIWLLIGRAGTSVDRGRRTVISWWGILGWRWCTPHDLRGFERIAVLRLLRRGESGDRHTYAIILDGGAGPLLLVRRSDLHQARDIARGLAAFAGLPLQDDTTT